MYTITWSTRPGEAFEQMQTLLADHPNRRADFRSALIDLARFLARTPHTLGTDDGSGLRVYHVYPLIVHFAVAAAIRGAELRYVYLWQPGDPE